MPNFAEAILAEATEFNNMNWADADKDTELNSLVNDLAEAIGDLDTDRAAALATETRRYLIANVYADADELPKA